MKPKTLSQLSTLDTLFSSSLSANRFIANPNGCYLLRSSHRRGSQIPQWIPLWKKIYFWVTLKSSQFPLFSLFQIIKIVFFIVSEIWVFQILCWVVQIPSILMFELKISCFYCFWDLGYWNSEINWQRMISKCMDMFRRNPVMLFPMLLVGTMLSLHNLLQGMFCSLQFYSSIIDFYIEIWIWFCLIWLLFANF